MNKKQNKSRSNQSRKKIGLNKNNLQDRFADEEKAKGFKKGEKFEADRVADFKQNDPQWYFKDANILKDVASFSYSHPLGNRISWDRIFDIQQNTTDTHYGISNWCASIPGLLTATIALTPGVATDAQDPINMAATNVYSYVRYKNSGASNYDSPDLMLYLLAMDSIYACWNWMKRIYGMASTYSQVNRYMPEAWIRANGVDFKDLMANLADFRGYLNIKTQEISAFCVPATMTYNIRHSWLFSNVYTDSSTTKAQQYMFVPAYFYKYSEATSEKGGELIAEPVLFKEELNTPVTLLKTSDLMAYLDSLLEAVNYSEDIGIMSGDILKAYGEGGLFKVSTFDADYRVEPVYSREVLSQIENSIAARMYATGFNGQSIFEIADFDVTQDPNTNFLQWHPSATGNLGMMKGSFLNFHWNSPTPEDVMVASRLKIDMRQSSDGTTMYIESSGSEFVMYYTLWANVQDSSVETRYSRNTALILGSVDFSNPVYIDARSTVTSATIPMRSYWLIDQMSAFDWHPMIWTGLLFKGASDAYTTDMSLGMLFDFDVYAVVDNDDLDALNTLALLTEFNVPN